MKIRTDFVTNSSSSSYVIAFRELPKIDDETVNKYPFLAKFDDIVERLIIDSSGYYDCHDLIISKEDVDCYILDEYGWISDDNSLESILKEDEDAKFLYNDMLKKINEGYKIAIKRFEYGDIRNDIVCALKSDEFIILNVMEG